MPNADATGPENKGSEGTAPTATDNKDDGKDAGGDTGWMREELSRARGEAASYRTKLRDAEAQRDTLQKSLTDETEKVKTLQVEVDDAKLFGLKLDTALDALGVDTKQTKAFADRLRGANVDELKTDAQTLVDTLGVAAPKARATDRSAGLGNDKPSAPEDAFGNFIADKLGWGQ